MIVITDKKNCTGCYACLSVCPQRCISMETDSDGFWYPVVDYNKCIQCDLCERVCPTMHRAEIRNFPQAYACINKDELTRMESSSGGLFTLIAEQVISNGGVVFGAKFDNEFQVVHSYVETIAELAELRGSKYVQSKIGETYNQAKVFLDQGKYVLFTGTPCQIAGLKSYLQKDYHNLFCIDIICHGVPSPKVWRRYVSYQEKRSNSFIRRIAFRRKDGGWKRFSVQILFENDTEYLQPLDKDLYMNAFLKDVCLRPSCYSCSFKTLARQSDITLADFWGIGNVCPEMDDDKGTSLVFVNSAYGKAMFERISSKLSYKEVDVNKAVMYNSAAVRSAQLNPKRDEFLRHLESLSFDELVKKYCSDSFLVKARKRIRAIVRALTQRTGLSRVAKKLMKRD